MTKAEKAVPCWSQIAPDGSFDSISLGASIDSELLWASAHLLVTWSLCTQLDSSITMPVVAGPVAGGPAGPSTFDKSMFSPQLMRSSKARGLSKI